MSLNFIKNKYKKIHFIGIGGISMSGLAEILLKNGYEVSGSDKTSSQITEHLKNNGAKIYIGHDSNNLKNVDLVVYTAAISNDNPELVEAKRLNIPLMDRASFLGELMKGHKYNVAISGTHGKTTTTSIISQILLDAKLDPTILVGGELDSIKGNVRTGKSEYFVTEACEYKASFLKFYPYIGIILNIDADHLDFYKDLDDIEQSFLKFAKLIDPSGYLIANFDDEKVLNIARKVNCNVMSFGINNGQIQAKNISFNNQGCPKFDVFNNNKKLFSLQLNIPGYHNILNTLAAVSTSLALNVSHEYIIKGIKNFKNAHRRFEIKGIKNNITVIDDYAHHPTEIKAALNAAKNYPHNKLYCVFQPHTYSRTISLFDQFVESFDNVDELILSDIYPAREKDPGTISSEMLCNKISERNVKCVNLHSFEDITKFLKLKAKSGDIVMTIGAGDIYKVGESFLNAI